MCVDFRDLNKASPKDDFPLPHIDILVDNTVNMRCYPLWIDTQVTDEGINASSIVYP